MGGVKKPSLRLPIRSAEPALSPTHKGFPLPDLFWQNFCYPFSMIISYGTTDRLATVMDTRVRRLELIAGNVANVDTPGYKGKDLDFSALLEQAGEALPLRRTDARHLGGSSAESDGLPVVETQGTSRPDGNNVSVEEEMVKLNTTNLEYNIATQLLSKKLRGLKEAIQSSSR